MVKQVLLVQPMRYYLFILISVSMFASKNVLMADAEDSKYVKGLQAEKAKLEIQLAANPNDDETNFLYAATLYLDLAEATEFKNLLISAGVSKLGPSKAR